MYVKNPDNSIDLIKSSNGTEILKLTDYDIDKIPELVKKSKLQLSKNTISEEEFMKISEFINSIVTKPTFVGKITEKLKGVRKGVSNITGKIKDVRKGVIEGVSKGFIEGVSNIRNFTNRNNRPTNGGKRLIRQTRKHTKKYN